MSFIKGIFILAQALLIASVEQNAEWSQLENLQNMEEARGHGLRYFSERCLLCPLYLL